MRYLSNVQNQHKTPANQHCHQSPRNPTHCPSRLSPWISSSNSLSRRDLTRYSRSPTTTVRRRQCSCRATRRSTQQEWPKLYATYVFPHYGLPKKVISDRDPRFASNFSREMCSLLGIKQNISTAYHPQTDGQSERTNQSLEQYLRLYCGTHQKDWAAWLPLAQYTRNSWPNASTKKIPYELILGYNPLAHQPVRDTTVPDIDTRMQLIKNAREQAQDALKQTQEHMIKGNEV